MDLLQEAISAISAQQGKERTPVWMAGEQLKDILRAEPQHAELIVQDMQNKTMLADCEKKIKAFADKHKTGNFACVTPIEAEEIIRKHFGLPERGTGDPEKAREPKAAPAAGKVIDLSAFF